MFNKYKSRGFGQYEPKRQTSNTPVSMPRKTDAVTKNGFTTYYQKPFEMPAKDIPNCYVHPLLQLILETKRPTKDPSFCLGFMTSLLDANEIAYSVDKAGNVVVDIDHIDDTMASTCFTSHTDTVDNKLGTNDLEVKGNLIYVKGGGVLGADCGTGMYIMIRMILALVPGHYVFFASEETGRVGSKQYEMPVHITKCVSFDRKGYDNLITTQSGRRGCSDAFADALIKEFDLPLVKDPTGSYTDSYTFFDTVNECINLSVGYFNQHTQNEYQDIEHLALLVEACVNAEWEDLPVDRDPVTALKNDYMYEYEDDYYYGRYSGYYLPTKPAKPSVSDKTAIEDFCFNNYYVAAAILMEYGITLKECTEFKQDIDEARRLRAESLSSKFKGGFYGRD